MMSLTGNSHPKLARCSRVARAPAQQRLPAFLNLHGIFTLSRKKRACRFPDKTCQEMIFNGLNNSFFITDSISTKSCLIYYDKNSFCQTCGFLSKLISALSWHFALMIKSFLIYFDNECRVDLIGIFIYAANYILYMLQIFPRWIQSYKFQRWTEVVWMYFWQRLVSQIFW